MLPSVQTFQQTQSLLGGSSPVVAGGVDQTFFSKLLAKRIVERQPAHAFGNRFDVFGLEQKAGIPRDFRKRSPSRTSHRDPTSHGLQDRQTEPFEERGEDKGFGTAVKGGQNR